MKQRNAIFLIAICLALSIPAAFALQKMWVSSDRARLKADKKASSATLSTVPTGTEVTVLSSHKRWYKIRTPSGKMGWMYRGRLSQSPPAQKSQDQTGDPLAGLSGSRIGADEASTSRPIRGLSPETEQYAKERGTPAAYKEALDRVLSMRMTDHELEVFLEKGKIGEYAP